PRTSGDLLRLTQALDRAGDDPSPEVGAAALLALGRYPFPDVRRRLQGRALDPKTPAGLRAAAKQALLPQPASEVRARLDAYLAVTLAEAERGDVGAPAPAVRWGVPEDSLLMAARDLLSPQGSLHGPAVERLAAHPDRAGRFPFLVHALKEPAAATRRAAVTALAAQGDLPAAEALEGSLDDPDTEVRRQAVAAVAARKDARAAELLAQRMTQELDPRVQHDLRGALDGQPEEAVLAAMAPWPAQRSAVVEQQAVAWLGTRTSTPSAALLVRFATRTPSGIVAELARGYLSGRPDGQVVPPTLEALGETEPYSEGRRRAGRLLGGREHPALTDALLNLLAMGQADKTVQDLLRGRPEPDVRPQVVALLDHLDHKVREPAAALAMGYQGEDVLQAAWRGLLRFPDDDALFAIFSDQGGDQLLPYWLHILGDDAFASHHAEALGALRHIRDARVPGPVAKAAAARPWLAPQALEILVEQPPAPALDGLSVLAGAPGLEDKVRADAVQAIEALAELPPERLEQALLPFAKDEARPVKHAARNALHRLMPTVYPSWDPYGRVPVIVEGAAFGAGLMLMATEIADADLSPWFVGGAGAVLGGATPFLLTMSEDVTLGDAGFFGTYGAWGTGAGLGLGLALFEEKRNVLWAGVAGETLGVATGALALRGLEWGLDDVAFANFTAMETGLITGGISAMILKGDARRAERAAGLGMVGGAASLVPLLFLNRKLVVEDEIGVLATTMVHGAWLGAFAPGLFRREGLSGTDAALAAAAGQGAGYLAGVVWSQLGDIRSEDAAWSMAGSAIGAATLGGLGILLEGSDSRLRFGLLEAGSAAGALTLGLVGRDLRFHENDGWLVTLLAVGGAVAGGDFSVRAEEGTLREPGLAGGMLMGAGIGTATGLALSQFVDVSDRTLWRSVLGGAVLGLAGAGLGQMIPDLTVRQRSPFTSVALLGGLVLTAPWAEQLDLSGRNLYFGASLGLTLGGLMALTPYHLHDGAPPGKEVAAGALFGGAAGLFGGVALAQRLDLSPAETAVATFAALAAASTGAGAGLLVPDSDPSLPVGLAQGLGLAGFGTVAGLLAADVLKVSRSGVKKPGAPTALRLTAFSVHGALHGALIPYTWRKNDETPAGREVAGGVMLGAGMGVLTGLGARALGAPRFGGDELIEASLLTTTLYAVGGGVGLAAEDRRLGMGLVHGLGIPAYAVGLWVAKDTEYDRDTPWTLALGAASGTWLGAWAARAIFEDPGANQVAGSAVAGAGLGALGGVVWSQLAEDRGEVEVLMDEAVLATVGGGLALWLRANDRASAAMVGAGSVVGLVAGAITAPMTRFSGTDAALVAYGSGLGALHGSLLPSYTGKASGRAHGGAALVGLGAGYIAAAAAAQAVELSPAEVAEMSGLTLVAEGMGAGLALMIDSDAPAARSTAFHAAGAVGVVASALIAPHTRYVPDDGLQVTLNSAFGAWVGTWAPYIFSDDPRTEAVGGSALFGAGVGVATAVGLSQVHRLSLADQGEAAGLGVAASAVGGGLSLMLDTDRRAQAALLDGAAILGLGLGLGLSPYTSYSGPDMGLFGLGTALGTWHGAWLPVLWGEATDRTRAGGALLGAGAGWLAAAAAGPFVEVSSGDQVTAGLLWSTGTALGAGVGLLLPSVEERGTVGLMEGLGAAGFLGGLVVADHLHFSTGDGVLLGAGTVLGAELGLTL
ncbi:MAG: HEAT repeat domain-containing protein, partial [Myxococcales bacterium]|nr:HEAT repeat domain-containing protein [Myxococcales bacterium]